MAGLPPPVPWLAASRVSVWHTSGEIDTSELLKTTYVQGCNMKHMLFARMNTRSENHMKSAPGVLRSCLAVRTLLTPACEACGNAATLHKLVQRFAAHKICTQGWWLCASLLRRSRQMARRQARGGPRCRSANEMQSFPQPASLTHPPPVRLACRTRYYEHPILL
jgi:hypothetical protein